VDVQAPCDCLSVTEEREREAHGGCHGFRQVLLVQYSDLICYIALCFFSIFSHLNDIIRVRTLIDLDYSAAVYPLDQCYVFA
jgi:hypothetical protein